MTSEFPVAPASRTGNVLKYLESRRSAVSKTLTELCLGRGLASLLPETQQWAIVGGVVRDSLLDPHHSNRYLWPPWPDIDVAILSQTHADLVSRMESRGCIVSSNTFGGLGVESEQLGHIDLWPVGGNAPHEPWASWQSYLRAVDFGPNAVLFCWPESSVLQDDRWMRDIASHRISRTQAKLQHREIQPLRAIALAQKLQRTLNHKFEFDAAIRRDLRWLVTKAPNTSVLRAKRYLEEKVTSGRWPDDTRNRLLHEASAYQRSERFMSFMRAGRINPCQP